MDDTDNTVEEPQEVETTEQPDYKALYEEAQANADKWKAMSRKNEQRYKDATSKPADTSELDELRKQLEAMKLSQQRDSWKSAAMAENGLTASDAAWVTGDTEEEMKASAAAFKARLDAVPKSQDMGNVATKQPPMANKQDIIAIKNEKERLAAIRENLDLFR